jgi:predicted RNase H-like HicB family nuclease
MTTVATLLQRTIKAVIRPGEQSGYVAECLEIAVVTQGTTLDEVTRNLKDAVALHIDGEDLSSLGFTDDPTIVVTMEIAPHDA